MESLSEALPVICYNIRGNSDLIKNGKNGYFVNSFSDVAPKIKKLNTKISLFNKIRLNAFKSINKLYLKKTINQELYKIFTNFI